MNKYTSLTDTREDDIGLSNSVLDGIDDLDLVTPKRLGKLVRARPGPVLDDERLPQLPFLDEVLDHPPAHAAGERGAGGPLATSDPGSTVRHPIGPTARRAGDWAGLRDSLAESYPGYLLVRHVGCVLNKLSEQRRALVEPAEPI